MNVRVFPLTLKESAQAAALHQGAFFKGWTKESIEDTLKTPSTFGLQIQEETDFAGYILWREGGEDAEILTLVISSPYQQKGYGGSLLNALYKELEKRKIQNLFIEVAEDNEAALALYHSHHFLPLGKRQNYYVRDNNNRICALTFHKKIV